MLKGSRAAVGWRGDAAAQTAFNVAAAGLTTATLAMAARGLPRAAFGHYAAVAALATLVSAASSLGVQATVMRGAGADPSRRRAMVEQALALRACAAVGASVAVAAVGYAAAPQAYRSLYLAVPALSGVSAAVSGLHLAYRSGGRARVAAAADCARAAVLAAGTAVMFADHALTASRLVAFQAGVGVVAVLTYAGPALRFAGQRSTRLSWTAVRGLAAESAGMWVIEVLNGLYLRADAVLLLLLAGSQALAGYSVAYRVVDLVMLIPGAVGLATMPALSAAPPGRRLDLVADMSKVTMTLGALVLVGGLLLAPSVVSLLGGAAYANRDVTTLRLLVVGASFSFPAGLAATAVLMFEGGRRLVRPTLAVVAVNVTANLVLDPRLGSRGAAVALIVSEALTCGLAFAAFRRAAGFRVPWRLPGALLPVVGAFSAAALAIERFVSPSGSGLWRLACGAAAGGASLVAVLARPHREALSGAEQRDTMAGAGR